MTQMFPFNETSHFMLCQLGYGKPVYKLPGSYDEMRDFWHESAPFQSTIKGDQWKHSTDYG